MLSSFKQVCQHRIQRCQAALRSVRVCIPYRLPVPLALEFRISDRSAEQCVLLLPSSMAWQCMQPLQPDNDIGLGYCYARVMCSKSSVVQAELERGSFRPGSRTCAFVAHNQLTGASSDVRLQEQISLSG